MNVSPSVIRRYVFIMGITLAVVFALWIFLAPGRAPGDFHTQTGDIRLGSGKYDEALEEFDLALEEMPDHRGALMGRALVFIHTGQDDQAVEQLTYLIKYLDDTLADDDRTGRGTLAAAYANRGIVHDRNGRHEEALQDYLSALRTDPEPLEGPGILDRIVHQTPRPATVAKRAAYLTEQFKLPENERVLLMPELDEKERTYKP
jgi:tetratricopeptide (TPR) repeat protein